MARDLINARALLVAFLVVSALALLHLPADKIWDLGHDGAGMYPADDCGRNFWMFFQAGDQPPCAVDVRKAEPVSKQAAKRVIEEHGQNGKWSGPEPEWLMLLEEKVAEILDELNLSWAMH